MEVNDKKRGKLGLTEVEVVAEAVSCNLCVEFEEESEGRVRVGMWDNLKRDITRSLNMGWTQIGFGWMGQHLIWIGLDLDPSPTWISFMGFWLKKKKRLQC